MYRYIDTAIISNIFYCHAIKIKYLNIFTYYYNMMPDPDKQKKIFICKKNTFQFFCFFFGGGGGGVSFFFNLSPSLLHICLKILSFKTAKILIS